MGQRLTTMTSGQARFPIAPSKFKFAQHGQCGMWVSELLPWTAKMVDDMCFIRSMHTEAINHEPAITFMQTGNQVTGRPCLGSWVSLRPGHAEPEPADVRRAGRPAEQHRAGAGDLGPAVAVGLPARRAPGRLVPHGRRPDPVHQQPARRPPRSAARRSTACKAAQRDELPAVGDPETHTRIAQYEMAFRMQTSVPELTDLSKEPENDVQDCTARRREEAGHVRQQLPAGPAAGRARRPLRADLPQQLGHSTATSPAGCPTSAATSTSRAAGLIQDLKQRGLLDDTLVIWGGEFGRTIYSQGGLTKDELRPRPPPALLHDVDGRRRHQGRHDLRRDRRLLATTSSRTRSTSFWMDGPRGRSCRLSPT